jgi:hypothetical protein
MYNQLMLKLSSFSLVKPVCAAAWSGTCVQGDVATIKGFECLFKNLLQVIGWAAGIVFFIMFIVGGFKYLTAAGDPKKAAAATSTLTFSIAGLIGVIVSWLIILLIKKLTGVNITNFTIGT